MSGGGSRQRASPSHNEHDKRVDMINPSYVHGAVFIDGHRIAVGKNQADKSTTKDRRHNT